jgi:hypothetical protein
MFGERDQEFGADVFAAVFIQTDIIAIFFHLANDGAFHIVEAISDPLFCISERFAFVLCEVIKMLLFQSVPF